MSHRTLRARMGVTLAVASAVTLTGLAPAMADPASAPDANDVVGVGSDTIEFVLQDLATAYNATNPADGALLASWNATGPADPDGKSYITPRLDATRVVRPNGSGSGKSQLYGASLNNDGVPGNSAISFARSSSSLNAAETNAGLRQYPFAVDALTMAVSKLQASHAPTSLDLGTILKIYNGTYTNWSQVPGSSGAGLIHPYIPQSGSGTRSFFEAQLTAAKGSAWSQSDYATSVREAQEHDPFAIKSDPDAIAPFSVARAKGLNSIKLEGGWSVQRAVYDVVRQADTGSAWVSNIFGDSGFLCSSAAKSVIENDGFQQLASGPNGACGVGGTTAVTNLLAAGQTATTTTLAADSASPNAATLTATVAKTRPAEPGTIAGVVDFYDQGGLTKVGSGTVDGSGVATTTLSNVPAGQHQYLAKFVPTTPDSIQPTQGAKTLAVSGATATTEALSPATSAFGGYRTATATVTSPGATPTGTVAFSINGWNFASANLAGGRATVQVPDYLNPGGYPVVATYAGSGTFTGSSASSNLTITKAASSLTESFASTIARGKRATGVIRGYLAGTGYRPSGTVMVKKGATVIGKGTLRNGVATLTLAPLRKGRYTLTMSFLGSSTANAVAKSFTITQR